MKLWTKRFAWLKRKGFYGWFMNLSGIQGLASMAVIVLLISGCSSQSKPDYDPLKVILWEACIDVETGEARKWSHDPRYSVGYALKACEDLRPVKK